VVDQGLPFVAVATGRPIDRYSAIGVDDYRAAREMTEYILALGHRDIGFIRGDVNLCASERRLAGYRDALLAAGIPFRTELLAQGSFTYRSGLDAAEKLLNGNPVPSAIFASNDDMAAAVIAVAHTRGLSVPLDLTICGYDDTTLATTVWPELTTVRQPIADMARAAVDLLAGDIKRSRRGERSAPRHIVQSFRLIERGSSAPLIRSPARPPKRRRERPI
jgi:LacI family transcriptional regulator